MTVCNIVAYAHEQGVIHRDIKPANIILGPFGEVLLLDWGLANVLNETMDDPAAVAAEAAKNSQFETHDGQVLGTPAFASPEQLFGHTEDVAVVSDVYALGATLFALLTGSYSIGKSAFRKHLNRLKRGQSFFGARSESCQQIITARPFHWRRTSRDTLQESLSVSVVIRRSSGLGAGFVADRVLLPLRRREC